MQRRSRKNTLKVEKGVFTKEKMKKDLGWSTILVRIHSAFLKVFLLLSPYFSFLPQTFG